MKPPHHQSAAHNYLLKAQRALLCSALRQSIPCALWQSIPRFPVAASTEKRLHPQLSLLPVWFLTALFLEGIFCLTVCDMTFFNLRVFHQHIPVCVIKSGSRPARLHYY